MSENRLGRETSPYLLQHKDNPVHWWAWGPEALAEAKQTGKPILLSVGYAACHWCHVMAHESFESEETARVMNELFVNIKVDREERPDVDAIYMSALHKLGQQGGWPLTMFLDTEARPFWGGTYFPPVGRWGRPGFADVLREVSRIYREDPKRVAFNAEALMTALEKRPGQSETHTITDGFLADLTARMVQAVDPVRGGINGAPKFPQWSFFWLLWRGAIRYRVDAAKSAVVTTLTNLCQGGIYDHLAGGFARYSTDEEWLVPHFEKMLYDNALLIDLMTEVWRETQNPLFKTRIEETVAWLLSEMVAEGGGFAASLDADSEGEEGKFYVWSEAEIKSLLTPDEAQIFSLAYGVRQEGNWEGKTILNRLSGSYPRSDAEEKSLAGMRAKLLEARAGRVRPGWDDKVLADWNGLMIAALARAAVVFERPDWLAAAERAFRFVARNMNEAGRLRHSSRRGVAKAPATASDYANMIWAALRLHEATTNDEFLTLAMTWSDVLERHYWDRESGGYVMSADDTEDVIIRLRTAQDEATPNANAIQLSNLMGLFMLTGEQRFEDKARALLDAFALDLANNLLGHCALLASTHDVLAPQLLVIVGLSPEGDHDFRAALSTISLPGSREYLTSKEAANPTVLGLSGKNAQNGVATAYACLGKQCSPPILRPERLIAELRRLRHAN
jgi:hypothetical protein